MYTSFRKITSMLYIYIMIRIFPTCICPATCFSQIIFVNFHCPSYVQFRSIFVFPCKTGHYSGNLAVSTRDTPKNTKFSIPIPILVLHSRYQQIPMQHCQNRLSTNPIPYLKSVKSHNIFKFLSGKYLKT